MYRCCTDTNKNQTIKVNFGRVNAGTRTIKSIRIVNESCKRQSYEARRDPITNPLNYVFNLYEYTWTVPPGGSFKCRICYRPVVPFHEDIDYFAITDGDCTHYEIVAHGICIGPNVLSFTPALMMQCPRETREAKKQLKLTNHSNITANFMFDIDDKQCPFKLDITSGSLEPFCSVYVTVTFLPPDQGLYVIHLSCLVQNQSPIVTELYGYFEPSFHGEDELCRQIFAQSSSKLIGFEGYMNDCSTIVRNGNNRPISLSSNYLVFDQAVSITENTTRRMSQVVCFTNHSRTDMSVHWDKDVDGTFDVKPQVVRVRARQSVLFEVNFDPREKNVFFTRQLVARAFWDYESSSLGKPTLVVPLVTSVRLIGHSFAAGFDSCSLPRYEVPQIVVLPPCIPSLPVYTTFVIRKYGHLPMMFRFIPPPTSHFTVKPMLGIISKDIQIVALEMFPESEDKLAYVERWAVQFNGDRRNEVFIDFRGYAEYPDLSFSNDNLVEFSPAYPGSHQVKQVPMRNVTRHCITYSFSNLPPELNLQSVSGEIRANEILTHDWMFCPSKLGDYSFEVNCRVTALKSGRSIGTSVDIGLRAVGRSELGFLVAIPDVLNFGTQRYNETRKLSFRVFNFSTVKIHFEMICRHRNWPVGCIQRDVRIYPTSETVRPGKNEIIDVCITPRDPGFYELSIQYFVRSNFPMSRTELRDICKVNCTCVLPTLKIKDLLYHGTCPSISKTLLWDVMELNRLNAILKDILPGQRRTMNMCFPALTLRKEPFLVKLLMCNSSPVMASWNLKRIQLCSCQQVAKTRSLTLKSMLYSCEHRQACFIYPKAGTLRAHEETVITIELRYLLLGTTELQWDISLGDDRHVILYVKVTGLSAFEREPLLHRDPRLLLDKIYIGDMDPMYQMYWMHNYTNYDVPYTLDTAPLCKVNKVYDSKVFSCMASHGIVHARTSKPVNFKFHPRKFGTFQVTVKLMLGGIETELALSGESCNDAKSDVPRAKSPSPFGDKFYISEIPVYFNADHITLSPIPTHGNVIRMITIDNKFQQDAFGYEWESYDLPGVLEIHVRPRKGTIQPETLQTFRLTASTKGYPCKITANVTCELVNVCERRAYEKNHLAYDTLCKELEGQFTITEKDITVPKPRIKEMKKPIPFHKTLAVCCYVYGPQDEQIKSTLAEQLKSTPPDEICIRKVTTRNVVAKKMINASTFILEAMMWNILDSKIFKNTIWENLSDTSDLKYSQFTMNLIQRKMLTERSYVVPPQRYIGAILEHMIFMVIHEEFALEIAHLTQPFDVRQLTYQRIYPQLRRKKINATCHLDENTMSSEQTIDESKDAARLISPYTVTFESQAN